MYRQAFEVMKTNYSMNFSVLSEVFFTIPAALINQASRFLQRVGYAALPLGAFVMASAPITTVSATPSDLPEVIARRGKVIGGTGDTKPILTLVEPTGGWTSSQMVSVKGSCSDPTADPVTASINGVRYYIRVKDGEFSRKFPAARGENTVTVECKNKGGEASVTRTITGVMSPVRLKVVLTSDTDGVYTDLHIYEPDGRHVYWADTNSPSGGLFFLNQQGDSYDEPGYGPYLYVHPSPELGVFRIDTNYWPGGAVQHTLANLDIIIDEGSPTEVRKRVRKPLARPGETQTLAYVVVRPNGTPVKVFVPGQDSPATMPPEVAEYQKTIEPKIAKESNGDEYAYVPPKEEPTLREAIVTVALSQAKKASGNWHPDQRDCAGLVRYAYREALAPRTREQERFYPKGVHPPALGFHPQQLLPTYPKLWRVGWDNLGGFAHDSFADAETLLSFNFRKIGRAVELAKSGDILAYKRETETGEQFHLMLFVGDGNTPQRSLAVYHTGAEPVRLPRRTGYVAPRTEHQVRVVPTHSLLESPEPIWIPSKHNPYFLGVFEWNHFNPKPRNNVVSARLS